MLFFLNLADNQQRIQMAFEFSDPDIRSASERDVAIVTKIIRKSFLGVAERFNLTAHNCPTHPSNCREQWIQEALKKGVRYYVLQAEGRQCGCVALELANPEVCYLERLAVLPVYRRRGYGRALVEYSLGEAGAIGVQKVDIGIIAEHRELKIWYQHIGFEEVRRATFDHLPFEVLFMSMTV
jgi:N-acetylglutamate synthase-like GNAT family acetyltransferase